MFVYSPRYDVSWGTHVFPVQKYRRTYGRLLAEGIAQPEEILCPEPATRAQLEQVHEPGYLDALSNYAEIGLGAESIFEVPLTQEILDSVRYATGGTILACHMALRGPRRAAMNLAGGYHHAFRDRGEGFCFVNDVAVAVAAMFAQGLARRVMVVDCDVHQGNGTARIFRGDSRVFTLDIHQEENYPSKERASLNIGLKDGTDDEDYLRFLGAALENHLGRFGPDLVLYVAGADPFCSDQLGGLAITKEGFARRDDLVFRLAREHGAAVTIVLAGSYPVRAEDAVDIHVETARRMKLAFGK
jgi:acetoin utilization deacetylase AcuC-like enzyme